MPTKKTNNNDSEIVEELLQNLKMSLGFGNKVTTQIVSDQILATAKNDKEKLELESKINSLKQNN